MLLTINPFQTGGAIVPALTLDVYNFILKKQPKATKLGDFS